MSLESKILAALHPKTGITARNLARQLGHDKSEINSVLYILSEQRKTLRKDTYEWFLYSNAETTGPTTGGVEKKMPEGDSNRVLKFEPTHEQRPVIAATAGSQVFVEAGPGTGKSETLVARLDWLLGDGGLNASQILVLSFSVAAVRELKARINRAHKDGNTNLAFIDIRTFDSFASRFLRLMIPQDELRNLDFDQRIRRATQELRANKNVLRTLGEFKHVLLDEMQDLVGVRADFALELLRVTQPCGFTLFGDSAQGIYDFTIESGPSRTTSGDLLKAIRKEWTQLDEKHRFTKNFRVGGNTELENIALHGRTLLLESPDKARKFLEKQFADLVDQGSTGNPSIPSDLLHEATCVVCRTNGQVLRLAGELHKRGIPFQMARDKNEMLSPPWLARIFLGWPHPMVSRKDFLLKAASALGVSEDRAMQLWIGMVSSFAPPKTISFNVTDLRTAITEGVVMPEFPLCARNTNVIQLSTIHRSKGREFSNVIVVMNTDGESTHTKNGEDKSGNESEPRVLFVALTRAKKTLHRMEAKAKGVWMPKERWIRSFTGDNGFNKLSSIQVGLSQDVDNDSFAMGEQEDVFENQRRLVELCRPGTNVELVFVKRDDKGCPIYKILVEKLPVGLMSTNFGWAVWHTLYNLNSRFKPNRFPKSITGIWIKEITTAVGDIGNEKITRAFLTSGLWLTLTLEGLGHCEW